MKYAVRISVFALLTTAFVFAQAPGSKLYISAAGPNNTVSNGTNVVTTNGPAFNLVLQAEIFKAKLPIEIVTNSVQADYVVHWATMPKNWRYTTATVSLIDKDEQVVWAATADKKTLHDCAENITKQLKNTMKHKKQAGNPTAP